MAQKSDYLAKLLIEYPDVGARYLGKIVKIDNVDPFSLQWDQLTNQIDVFPNVTNMDIVTYMVLTTSYYTHQQMKAFKTLSSYKWFESGFVHQCGCIKINGYSIIIGRVKHSQRMNKPSLHVWVICQEDGSIETAHCTCMAGLGEVCSHVGALLYAVQHIIETREKRSCTDLPCLWNMPKLTTVPYEPIKKMDLGRIIASHKVTDPIPSINDAEMVELLDKIKQAESSSVLMRIIEPFASDLETTIPTLPNLYSALYSKDYEPLSYEELLHRSTQILQDISADECRQIEELTREQSRSTIWFQQ